MRTIEAKVVKGAGKPRASAGCPSHASSRACRDCCRKRRGCEAVISVTMATRAFPLRLAPLDRPVVICTRETVPLPAIAEPGGAERSLELNDDGNRSEDLVIFDVDEGAAVAAVASRHLVK